MSFVDLQDATGDGRLDLLLSGRFNRLLFAVAEWRSDGRFDPAISASIPDSWSVTSEDDVHQIVEADLDGDRDVDILVAMAFAVGRFETVGNGELRPVDRIPVGSNPLSLAAFDADGDQWLDVVTANGGNDIANNISVLLNDGTGRIAVARNFVNSSAEPTHIAALDYDLDGDLDVSVREATPGRIAILKNDGLAHFERAVEIPISSSSRVFQAMDLDGDSDDDLVIPVIGVGSLALVNLGAGRFELNTFVVAPTDGIQFALGDIDGDMDIDSVFASEARCQVNLIPRWNTGGLVLERGVPCDFGRSKSRLEALAIADLDQDGLQDVAGISSSGDRPYEPIELRVTLFSKELVSGSLDADHDRIPDECEPDCNANLLPDGHDIASGDSQDCNANGLPDECELDCNSNDVADECELIRGEVQDCNQNGVPDTCESNDANRNGVPDDCELAADPGRDCDRNGELDEAEGQFEPRWANLTWKGLPLADLNGDGAMDAVYPVYPWLWPSRFGLSLSVRNLTTSTKDVLIPVRGVQGYAVADFDMDGDMDFVVNQGRCEALFGSLWSFSTNEAGFVRAAHMTSTRLRSGPILAAELSSDGIPDLLLSSDGNLWLLPGDGSGSFGVERLIGAKPGGGLPDLVADLIGDESLDLAWTDGRLLIGSGTGTFEPGPNLELPFDLPGLSAADLDGDLDLDLVARGILENVGNGVFRRIPSALDAVLSPAIADFDRDGDADAVFVLDDCDGHGPSMPRFISLENSGSFRLKTRQDQLTFSIHGIHAEAADWDGDGSLDLTTDSQHVLWNHGNGSFGVPVTVTENWEEVDQMVACDIDGDGDIDLVCRRSQRLAIATNDGTGSLRLVVDPSAEECSFLAVDDLDGNRIPDLIVVKGDRIVSVRWDIGKSPAREPTTLTLEKAEPGGLFFGDFDGDARMDLAVGDHSPRILLNAGVGGLQDSGELKVPEELRVAGTGDFDGDRRTDFVAYSENLGLVLAQYLSDSEVLTTRFAEIWPGATAAVDLNGDGRDELVVAGSESFCNDSDECRSYNVIVQYGFSPEGKLGEAHRYQTTGRSGSMTLADIDLDGDLDLLVPVAYWHDSDGADDLLLDIKVFEHDSSGVLVEHPALIVNPSPLTALVVDLTGDGLPEVAVLHGDGDDDYDNCESHSRNLLVVPQTALRRKDLNHNGILDACESARFLRGDWNADGAVNLSDAVSSLGFLFQGALPPQCYRAGDTDDSGTLDISDAITLLRYLFLGGQAPPAPSGTCGWDPTDDSLSCESFAACSR